MNKDSLLVNNNSNNYKPKTNNLNINLLQYSPITCNNSKYSKSKSHLFIKTISKPSSKPTNNKSPTLPTKYLPINLLYKDSPKTYINKPIIDTKWEKNTQLNCHNSTKKSSNSDLVSHTYKMISNKNYKTKNPYSY